VKLALLQQLKLFVGTFEGKIYIQSNFASYFAENSTNSLKFSWSNFDVQEA